MKTVRSLVKFRPDLLKNISDVTLTAPTKKSKASRARVTTTASSSLKTSATAYVEHELAALQQTLDSEAKSIIDPWQHLLARRRIFSLHPDCATSLIEPVSIAAVLWSIEQVCILDQTVYHKWKNEFTPGGPHSAKPSLITREKKFRKLLQPFIPLHGESQLVVAARSLKLRQGLCQMMGTEARLEGLRHQVASLPKKVWIELLASSNQKKDKATKVSPRCSNIECRGYLGLEADKQQSVSLIKGTRKKATKRQKIRHGELYEMEKADSAPHERGLSPSEASPNCPSADSSPISHPLKTHHRLRSYLATVCTLCGSEMSLPTSTALERGQGTMPAVQTGVVTKGWKLAERNEAVLRGLESTNQLICTALRGSRKSLGRAAVWHHLGDIIFLFRNLALLSAGPKIHKTTQEYVLQWISKWNTNQDLSIHDSMQTEILMGAAECLHARSELQARGIIGDDGEKERDDASRQIKVLKGALKNHCFEDLIRYDPREMDGRSHLLGE